MTPTHITGNEPPAGDIPVAADGTPVGSGGGDDVAEAADQRNELHFLAALTDELMRALGATGALTRAQLNGIEESAAKRAGTTPRPW